MKIWSIIVLSLVLTIIINAVYCTNTININHYYTKTDKYTTNLHFVFISDLHNKEFGTDNKALIDTVKSQNPDFIAVGGDLVVQEVEDDSVMKNLLSQLSKIAPTYCVLGNHEVALSNKFDFKAEINSTGAVLLDNEIVEITKDGTKFALGGITDFPFYEASAPTITPDSKIWGELMGKSKDEYTILLHHHPEYITNYLEISKFDLVLCGHTHGGLVRIPFGKGIFVPNQGFFAQYDKGEFEFAKTKMIITSGLGNSNPLPRINNQAEICVIDIN